MIGAAVISGIATIIAALIGGYFTYITYKKPDDGSPKNQPVSTQKKHTTHHTSFGFSRIISILAITLGYYLVFEGGLSIALSIIVPPKPPNTGIVGTWIQFILLEI